MMTVAELLKDKAAQSGTTVLYSINTDATVAEAVAVMTKHDISSIVVLDNGEMAGLITLRELLHGMEKHGAALVNAQCRNVMKVNPPVATLVDTADHLRSVMSEHHITHVPVLENGKMVGILSFQDIARSDIKDTEFENKLLKQYIKNWPDK
jgi:CBS domain-containing protein